MNKTWLPIVTRRMSVYRTFMTAEGSRSEVARYLGHGCDYLAINADEQCSVYLAATDTKRVSDIIVQKIAENQHFADQNAADCRAACAALVAAGQIASKDIKKQNATELTKRFKAFSAEYIRFAKFMAIPVTIEKTLTNRIIAAVQTKVGTKLTSEYMSKLMTTPTLSEFQKEQLELLEIAITNKSTKLTKHSAKYAWLACYNIDDSPYTTDYFVGRLNELKKNSKEKLMEQYQELRNQHLADQEIYQKSIQELGLDAAAAKEVSLLREYVYLRTFRVEMQSKANLAVQALFRAIANHFGLSLRHTVSLTPGEITTGLTDKTSLPTIDRLEVRCRWYGFRFDADGKNFVEGKIGVLELEKQELGKQETSDSKELRGTIAYKGVATGTVRVVLTKEGIKDFKQGEILITTMTTPEFVPAMKKAAAIVTNEGGVLCHAAIVARELKVPCIIGTVGASKILRTGDDVEVDANNGIVRKK